MKALVRTLQILAVVGAVISGVLFLLVGKVNQVKQTELDEAKSQLQFEQNRANSLAANVETLKSANEEMEGSIADSTTQIIAFEAKLSQLQRENQRAEEQKKLFEQTEERLQSENARIARELAELQANSVSKDSIAQYETKIGKLERQILELKQTQNPSDSARSISAIDTVLPENPRLTGHILTVGEGVSVVVIDIGYNDGVRLKNELIVTHADTPIAKIQVYEVKENLSLARVLPDSITKTPKSGDSVTSLN